MSLITIKIGTLTVLSSTRVKILPIARSDNEENFWIISFKSLLNESGNLPPAIIFTNFHIQSYSRQGDHSPCLYFRTVRAPFNAHGSSPIQPLSQAPPNQSSLRVSHLGL